MTTDVYSRWYRAYSAYTRAQNPEFKNYWWGVMQKLQENF